jgi:hypothetical protein
LINFFAPTQATENRDASFLRLYYLFLFIDLLFGKLTSQVFQATDAPQIDKELKSLSFAKNKEAFNII